MVSEDSLELIKLFGQDERGDSALWELGERLVSGGENGEGASALEGFYEACGAQSGGEGGEAASGDCGINDVMCHFS